MALSPNFGSRIFVLSLIKYSSRVFIPFFFACRCFAGRGRSGGSPGRLDALPRWQERGCAGQSSRIFWPDILAAEFRPDILSRFSGWICWPLISGRPARYEKLAVHRLALNLLTTKRQKLAVKGNAGEK
jgi:hypothetical protein